MSKVSIAVVGCKIAAVGYAADDGDCAADVVVFNQQIGLWIYSNNDEWLSYG